MFYYRGLHEWNRVRGYLLDTCLTAQDNYKAMLVTSGLNTNNRKAKYYIPNPPKNLLPFSVVAYFWLEELGLSFIVYSL